MIVPRWLQYGMILALSGVSSPAWASDALTEPVEIIIQDHTYPSIKEYHREKIKQSLTESLGDQRLDLFTEAELLAILKEIRREQVSKEPVNEIERILSYHLDESGAGGKPADGHSDMSIHTMQAMLAEYQKKNREAKKIIIDPQKVKNVLIEPPASN